MLAATAADRASTSGVANDAAPSQEENQRDRVSQLVSQSVCLSMTTETTTRVVITLTMGETETYVPMSAAMATRSRDCILTWKAKRVSVRRVPLAAAIATTSRAAATFAAAAADRCQTSTPFLATLRRFFSMRMHKWYCNSRKLGRVAAR